MLSRSIARATRPLVNGALTRTAALIGILLGSGGCGGCDGNEAAPSAPAASASAAKPAPAASLPGKPRGVLVVTVTGRSGSDTGQPAVIYRNQGDKAVASFDVYFYAYDAAGNQLKPPFVVTNKTPTRPIRPREMRELEMSMGDVPPGATVEAVVPHVVFVDQSEWRDMSLAPEVRPQGG